MSVYTLELIGGLCNKLQRLAAACVIAIETQIPIEEPIFGKNRQIYMSEIFDIDFFNKSINEMLMFKNLIIKKGQHNLSKIPISAKQLWNKSCKLFIKARKTNSTTSLNIFYIFLKSLKLCSNLNTNIFPMSDIAIHCRIEIDWKNYSIAKKNENIYINVNEIMNACDNIISKDKKVYLASGDKQSLKNIKLVNSNILYFENSLLDYDECSAIELFNCINSSIFIGHSRSTFSNTVTMVRSKILNISDNYIYNSDIKLKLRTDYGIHCDSQYVTNNVT